LRRTKRVGTRFIVAARTNSGRAGEGLTREQLIAIAGLSEDTAHDVLTACEEYLVAGGSRYCIYHQSFRDFLLADKTTRLPGRTPRFHRRVLDAGMRLNWASCKDEYALKHTPFHWAEAAALSRSSVKSARKP
jgi:hypothetical protein